MVARKPEKQLWQDKAQSEREADGNTQASYLIASNNFVIKIVLLSLIYLLFVYKDQPSSFLAAEIRF